MTNLENYCTQILDGKIIACDKMKQMSNRLLDSLYNPNEFHFDADMAAKHINFIEKFCKTPSGNIGTSLKLELFQKARFEAIFGFVDDNDLRQYNEVLIIEGRKNGKTTECAAIELDMLINDHEGSPQIYNVATQREQASLGFNAAHKMVMQSPMLAQHVRKRVNDLYFPTNMGFIKALASNSNSLDGLDIHCAIIDELAAIKNRDIYDLVKQAMGARKQPLLFCITTNGFVRNGIFDAQYAYASNIISGTVENKRFLPFIYELDHPSEIDNRDMHIKANPAVGTIKSREFLDEMVQKANDDKSFKPTVLVKDFNIPQNETTAWLPYESAVNETVVPMEYLEHSYAIGGCDLSSTLDLTCATLIIQKPNDDNLYVLQQYFIPQAKADAVEQSNAKEAPYKLWAEKGWLTICEGASVDYHAVTEWFCSMVTTHDIRPLWICYDRALAGYWQEEMTEMGFEMVKIPQGPYVWTYPMKSLEGLLQEHKIVYQNNPMLRWCLSNTAKKSTNADGIESIQPVKIQSQRRIDGMVSLLNAYVGYTQHINEYIPYLR